MALGAERFLTTHTGSLPRPDDLIRTMFAKEEGVPVDRAALDARIGEAVSEIVKKQAASGIAGRCPIHIEIRSSACSFASPGNMRRPCVKRICERRQSGGASSPANSTVPAKRKPVSIGVATNLPSASAVGMRGMTSGSRIIRW